MQTAEKETGQAEIFKSGDRLLDFDLSEELNHGIAVSNLAYAVAAELGQDEEFCYQMAIAGMLHDIGKLKLTGYINGQENDPLLIEELKYVRMHSSLGYEELKDQGYSELVLQRGQHSAWSQNFACLRCLCGTELRQTLQKSV